MLKGKAFKFGDDISTDLITPGRFVHLRSNLPKLAKHTLEDADPTFAKRVGKGDFVVAGKNFGLGSSREHAPLIIKMCGVSAILAKSAARIFFRNATNLGLPVLICDTDKLNDGDTLQIDLKKGEITEDANPNGSLHNIAGIISKERNVLGMMPHPERCCEAILGGEDGRFIFESILKT